MLPLWLPSPRLYPHHNLLGTLRLLLWRFCITNHALNTQISEVSQIGVRSAILFAMISVGALTGGLIGGVLVVRDDGTFTYLQVFCVLCMAMVLYNVRCLCRRL